MALRMRVHRCHHALPRGQRWSRALGALPYPSQSPTIRSTIETFPKRAIYLFPINRSVVIKKSIWPGWASLAARERRLCARPQDYGGSMRATEGVPEDRVPGHSCSRLSNPLGLQAEGTGETCPSPFLSFLQRAVELRLPAAAARHRGFCCSSAG